ncbi:NACHT, LRR and PYD domains-containing protein 5 [Equus asinus]|uniref:NACHT, LRR and PYD domains-containing protein 5 n=1 Tax=Equus asinus TaxID=9793 RepID=UPI0038F775F7
MEEAKVPSLSNYGLQWCFKQLSKEEFQTFKELLNEKASELEACSFPWVEVNNANIEHLASLLHEHYRGSLAWKISINIFEKMNLSALSEKARDEMKKYSLAEIPKASTPKTDQEPSMEEVPEISQVLEQDGATATETKEQGDGDDKWYYKSYVMTKFAMKLDACYGFKNFASEHPEMQTLLGAFKPDQNGFQPRTVVLHGEPGIGKSTLARRILLSWAQGEVYQDLFSYAFFLCAREIQQIRESTLAELISREWPDSPVPVMEIMSQPERLLFVVDGFDDLDFVFKDGDINLCEDWAEKQPMSILMYSLLKKVLLPESSLIITVRDAGIEKLKSIVMSPRYLLLEGISVEKRIQLLLQHIKNDHQKMQVLQSVVDNHLLFDKCQVSVVCSLICEALKLQEMSGKGPPPTCQTLTGLYATFVFHQLTPQDAFPRALSQEERVVLKGVCRLAVEGMWNMKSVFYGDDLGVHGLRKSELSALFHMNILLQDSHCERCYSFLHLSLQEFCAALYYVLVGLEREGDLYPLFIENIGSLTELKQFGISVHLLQMKRFLFGLMSKEVIKTLEALLGCPVPVVVKQKLLHWISLLGQQANSTAPLDFLDAFYCLFETQDEEFVRLALNSFQEVRLPMNRRMDLIVSSFCLPHCRYLRKIRMDVREILSRDELTEAWPMIPEGMQTKTFIDKSWENLCFVLSTHPNLRELDLSGSVLDEWAIKTLCVKLRQPTCKIQNLIFKGAQITLGLRHLWMTLLVNRNIKYLNLERTRLKNEDVGMACEALRHPNCLLESLRLDHCGLTHACCVVISQILMTSINLKSLSLAGNKVTDQGMKPLCDALKVSQCTLQRLILGNCGLTAADCQDLASSLISNLSLTHLDLSSNSLGSEGMNLLYRTIKLPNCGLQRLILNECNLDIASCGFLGFALVGNRRLTHLSLSMNPLEDAGVNLLCEVMMEPSCHLQDLELVKCNLTAACCKNLSRMISTSKRLRSLDLAANALRDEGIVALCQGLKQRKSSLRRLGLEACELTSGCCEVLSSALSCNQHLTSLNLIRNNFSPGGMMKLCSAFAHPTSNLQIIGLWKLQFPAHVRKMLEEVQLLKPHIIIDDGWYSFDGDDRYWWKN